MESALSGVGQVAEVTRCVCSIAEAAIAEATFVYNQVESRVASLVAHTKVRMAQGISPLSECIREVAVHTEEQTSCIAGTVAQQLEKEIEAVAVSTITTSERNM